MSVTKRPTIRDVAAEAGVSKSLVSLVFAGETGVSQERREKVLAAAKKLGFTPNLWARSLSSGSANFVAMIVADLHNPLFTEIADFARKDLLEKGINTVMAAAVISERNGKKILEASTVNSVLDLRPRSIFIVGGLPDYKALKSVPASVPIVMATGITTQLPRAITVRSDDNEGMRLLVKHLVGLGHQRISYVGPVDEAVSVLRRAAYEKAMFDAGLAKFAHIEECDRTESSGYSAAKLLLSSPTKPTAIVAFNDIIAIGAQDAVDQAVEAGGPKVALTGYDNVYISALSKVSLTSIEQEKAAIAHKAAELLADGDLAEEFRGKEILLLPKLVARESTTTAPVK
ncbi:LacI family DNA-binding transcriptional regulator [Rhodoluna sp. KAS3]|uniref:LacI family DNA-binding transcriptional regulator n=1 Tax=Rhodoluna sp. KAS3 TaxID=942880 RepID=UPI00222F06E0|nr:LacI family DNA-binding transcriptional regulator [Rhodoluna sp. KAS3]BDS49670.1 LacI family transcriptional regulator [Rhodoluna sp. KAS3]